MIEELENMAEVENVDEILSKCKAITGLFPYAVYRERDGDQRMVDAFLGIIRAPKIGTLLADTITTTLFEEASPDFPNRVVTLLSPYAYWGSKSDPNSVTRWATAALAVPYTEEVGRSVVDTLLQIAFLDRLRPHIPIDIWALLKKRPSLPPICEGRWLGTNVSVVRRVRELRDAEILESYFLVVWSEWDYIWDLGETVMIDSIREDLGGIRMGHHREVLIKRLDHVLGQLDRGFGYLVQHKPDLHERETEAAKESYEKLRNVLLEVDGEALKILARKPSGQLICSVCSPQRTGGARQRTERYPTVPRWL